MKEREMGRIHILDQADSTNTEMRRRVTEFSCGDALMARVQTAGRGRGVSPKDATQPGRRSWSMFPGDLAISFWLEPRKTDCSSLSLSASLAVLDTLRFFGIEGRCKWPNDILVRGRKICGILAEYVPGTSEGVIMGIGINIAAEASDLAVLDRPATSMRMEGAGVFPSADEVAEVLSRCLSRRFEDWKIGGFACQAQEWYERCAHRGAEVRVVQRGGECRGRTEGVTCDGRLILMQPDGTVSLLCSGDVERVRYEHQDSFL